MTDNARDLLIDTLGGLIANLHVLRSLGSPMVPPQYDEVRDLIGDFGWSSGAEVAAKLRTALGTWTPGATVDPIEPDYSFLDDFEDAHPGVAPTNVPMGVVADVDDEPLP